mgnify:FL=1
MTNNITTYSKMVDQAYEQIKETVDYDITYKEVRSFVYEAVCLVSKIHDINYAGLRLNDDTKFHTEIAELIVNTVLTIIKYEDY